MTSSNRDRDRDQHRQHSLSQSLPPFHRDTHPPEGQASPRRRSFEASSSPAALESRKTDTVAGVGHTADAGGVGDAPAHHLGMLSRKGSSEVGLGKLGRRISVGMSLGVKKEKKSKAEREPMTPMPEGTMPNGNSNGVNEGGMPVHMSHSKPPSRQPSPIPKVKTKLLPKLSEHDMQKVTYLRRLLEDSGPGLLVPLAISRIANATNLGANSGAPKISATHGVMDSLRMFTAVEALDGDNMFGCRNVRFLSVTGVHG